MTDEQPAPPPPEDPCGCKVYADLIGYVTDEMFRCLLCCLPGPVTTP